jgi:isopenicillin N synthase-like dioxygenase
MDVLVVDLDSPTAPQDFVRSLRSTGFAVLRNHPVPKDLVESVHQEWHRFFSSDAKHAYLFRPEQDGYYPPSIAETAKGASVRDLKEFFHVYEWGQYPAEVSGDALELRRLGAELAVTLLGWAEAGLPADVAVGLSVPLSSMMDGSTRTMLRVLHYPPLSGGEEPGAVRAAAHEDINLITVLPGSQEPGLQVLDRAGRWHDVPADPGTVVINAGDMLQLATGGWYPSTTHRVVNPAGEGRSRSRMSTPLFLHPADAVQLSPDWTALAFLQERIRILRGLDVK